MIQVPLASNGQASLLNTGIRVPTVAQNVAPGPDIGQGLMRVSGMTSDMAFQMRQADDTTGMVQAEGIMKQHAAEQQLFQQKNPDQNTWEPAWQDRYSSMQEQLAKIPLSNQARKRLDLSLDIWHKREATSIAGQAVSQANNRAVQAVTNLATQNAMAGNPEGVEQAWKLHPPGMAPEELESMKLKLMGQARDVRRQDIANNFNTALDSNQPETARLWLDKGRELNAFTESEYKAKVAALEAHQEYSNLKVLANDDPWQIPSLAQAKQDVGKISPEQRVDLVNHAKSVMEHMRSDAMSGYQEELKYGVPDKNEFAKRVYDDRRLHDVDKIDIQRALSIGPVNDPITYASLYAEAKNFADKEGSSAYSRFLSRVDMTLTGDQKSSVLAELSASVKGTKDNAAKAKAALYTELADDLRGGLFGTLHGRLADLKTNLTSQQRAEVDAIKSEIITPDELNRLKTEPTRADYLEGKARQVWFDRHHPKPMSRTDSEHDRLFRDFVVDDVDASRLSSGRMWQAAASLEKWLAENPKATPQEARAYKESLLTRQRAAIENSAPSMTSMPPVDGLQGAPQPVSILPPIDTIRQKYAPNSRK